MHRCLLAAVLAVVTVATSGVAGEVVESPIYKSWSKSKVGTAITLKSTTVMKGQTIESSVRYELVYLAKDKAIVEMTTTDAKGGVRGTQKLDYFRDFPLLPGMKKEDIGKPVGVDEKGEETLKLAGKEFQAQWYVVKGRTEAGESIARTWTASDFPGMMLKTVIKVPAGDKVTTMEVVEIKTP